MHTRGLYGKPEIELERSFSQLESPPVTRQKRHLDGSSLIHKFASPRNVKTAQANNVHNIMNIFGDERIRLTLLMK